MTIEEKAIQIIKKWLKNGMITEEKYNEMFDRIVQRTVVHR